MDRRVTIGHADRGTGTSVRRPRRDHPETTSKDPAGTTGPEDRRACWTPADRMPPLGLFESKDIRLGRCMPFTVGALATARTLGLGRRALAATPPTPGI